MISRTVLRDFAGLENMDEETTAARALELNLIEMSVLTGHLLQALLNFSYHLACGNTDEEQLCLGGIVL